MKLSSVLLSDLNYVLKTRASEKTGLKFKLDIPIGGKSRGLSVDVLKINSGEEGFFPLVELEEADPLFLFVRKKESLHGFNSILGEAEDLDSFNPEFCSIEKRPYKTLTFRRVKGKKLIKDKTVINNFWKTNPGAMIRFQAKLLLNLDLRTSIEVFVVESWRSLFFGSSDPTERMVFIHIDFKEPSIKGRITYTRGIDLVYA